MKYQLHKSFVKSYRKLPEKVKNVVKERLAIFGKNPLTQALNDHALSGKYQGYRSINITGDYRAVYGIISETEVVFVALGTHAQLYR